MQSKNWTLFPKPHLHLGDKGSKFTATNIGESLARYNHSSPKIWLQVKIKDNSVAASAQRADSTDDLINWKFQSQTLGLGSNTIVCYGHLHVSFIAIIYQRGFVNSYPDSGKWPCFLYLQEWYNTRHLGFFFPCSLAPFLLILLQAV